MGCDLVLIQTPYFDDYGPMRKAAGTYFPLGLGYIASYVKQYGFATKLLDPNVQPFLPEDIAQNIVQASPALIGISFMTPQFSKARQLCQVIRASCPGIPIILGGAHPSVLPIETMKDIPEADYIAIGEAEVTVKELLIALRDPKPSSTLISGIAYRDGDTIRLSEPRPPIQSLDDLPFPDRDLIDYRLYHAQSFLSYSSKAASIYTSRGCPGKCVFCCSGHQLRSPVRERKIDNVMQEIDWLVKEQKMRYLLIKDDTFTMKRSRVREFCEAIHKRHPRLKWHCMGRVNTVDGELLSEMKRAGLSDIFFGIESGNDQILRNSRKGITIEQSRNAVNACDTLGIRTYGAFILGLPGDSPETIQQTIDYACSIPLTMAGFSILIPYPGTHVYEEHLRHEEGQPMDYQAFVASTGMHYVENYTGLKDMSPSDLPAWVMRAQKQFYHRPSQILRMMRHASFSQLGGYARGFLALCSKNRILGGKGKCA